MESFPIQFCKGIRSYWRSRKYQKLKSSNQPKRLTRFGETRNRTRRFRLRSVFRVRIRVLSPVRILARVRDAYVDAMLGVAGNGLGLSGSTGPALTLGRRVPKARPVQPEPGDFERRLIMEIYNSVMASKEFAANNNPKGFNLQNFED